MSRPTNSDLQTENDDLIKQNQELQERLAMLEKEYQKPMESVPDQSDVNAYLMERVPFRAFKDDSKYKDDFTAQVNGSLDVIQRGKDVMVPRYVLFAIENAERQRAIAATTSQHFENQYTAKQDKF